VSGTRRVAVGSAHRSQAGGRVEVLELARDGGGPVRVRVLDSVATGPVAFLAAHPTLPLLYVAGDDGEQGVVTAYAVTTDGRLEEHSAARSPGRPSHVHVADDGRHVLTANYGSASVGLFRLDDDGAITGLAHELACEGSGPTDRQESAHPHQVIEVDGEFLVPDLGADVVRRLEITDDDRLRETGRLPFPAGSGPRHAVAVDGVLYVACELSGEVRWDVLDGAAGFASVIPSSMTDAEEVAPSAIRVVDDRILVANRGPGTVLVTRRDGAGLVEPHEYATGGTWPRDVIVAGDLLVVADHRADEVHVVDTATPHGLLAVHRVSGPIAVLAV